MSESLTFERIQSDFEALKGFEETTYFRTYGHFIKYFAELDKIDVHHLVISSHFVYGWMPTIIELNLTEAEKVISNLNKAKQGELLNVNELEIVKACINNSMVGTSKLLHFINPRLYAIWDSRIYRYLTRQTSTYGIAKPTAYLQYLDSLHSIANHQGYAALHSLVERHAKTSLTPMRAIEMILFKTSVKI